MTWTTHGHHIDGTIQDSSSRPANVMRCGGPRLCPTCKGEAKQVLGVLRIDPVSQEDANHWIVEENRYNSETLEKTLVALTQAVGKTAAHECIREMQNAGILFRERM